MRAKALQTVALLALAVSTASAQVVGPVEKTVAKGEKNVSIEVSVIADSAEYLALGNLEMIREFTRVTDKLVIRVLTDSVGEGYVVVAAVKDGKMLPLYKCKVYVVDVGPAPRPPVPPKPGPVDPPPLPTDPLVKALRDAAANDGMPKSQLADMAIAAKASAGLVKVGQTAKRTHDLIKVALSKSPPLGISMFEVVNGMTGEVYMRLLKNPDEVLDATTANAVKAPLVKLADALVEATK